MNLSIAMTITASDRNPERPREARTRSTADDGWVTAATIAIASPKARRKQPRHDEGSALPRDGKRSDRQDGNADARPRREPSPQRTTHRNDDNEHDQRCAS